MPAGGPRPGAGAPIGNTNPHKAVALATALKSGRHSARFKAVLTAMSQVPEVRDYFALVRRRQLRSERLAAAVLRKALGQLLHGSPAKNNPVLAYLKENRPASKND